MKKIKDSRTGIARYHTTKKHSKPKSYDFEGVREGKASKIRKTPKGRVQVLRRYKAPIRMGKLQEIVLRLNLKICS